MATFPFLAWNRGNITTSVYEHMHAFLGRSKTNFHYALSKSQPNWDVGIGVPFARTRNMVQKMETIGIGSNFFRHQVFPKSGVKEDGTVNTEYHHPQSPYAKKIYCHPSIVQISSATKCANPSRYLTLLVKTNSLVEKVETQVVHYSYPPYRDRYN